MKSPEEMAARFKAMPKKEREPNPYWEFVDNRQRINDIVTTPSGERVSTPIDLTESKPTLMKIREFFRRYYASFHTEAQVLCVTAEDATRLNKIGIPILGMGQIGSHEVTIVVLPQDNSGGTSRISEEFWQNRIVAEGIKPIARIHSHHVLDSYQSGIDYTTLNSGTLEIVMGRIFNNELHICYWLDVPGTDIKAHTFVAVEDILGDGFIEEPRIFHGVHREDPSSCAANYTAKDDL